MTDVPQMVVLSPAGRPPAEQLDLRLERAQDVVEKATHEVELTKRLIDDGTPWMVFHRSLVPTIGPVRTLMWLLEQQINDQLADDGYSVTITLTEPPEAAEPST